MDLRKKVDAKELSQDSHIVSVGLHLHVPELSFGSNRLDALCMGEAEADVQWCRGVLDSIQACRGLGDSAVLPFGADGEVGKVEGERLRTSGELPVGDRAAVGVKGRVVATVRLWRSSPV